MNILLGFSIYPLRRRIMDHSLYDSSLDVAWKILLGKKCVCDIRDRDGKYGNILNFDSCNGKMVESNSYCFVLLGGC
jgi:hypothetical protein